MDSTFALDVLYTDIHTNCWQYLTENVRLKVRMSQTICEYKMNMHSVQTLHGKLKCVICSNLLFLSVF